MDDTKKTPETEATKKPEASKKGKLPLALDWDEMTDRIAKGFEKDYERLKTTPRVYKAGEGKGGIEDPFKD